MLASGRRQRTIPSSAACSAHVALQGARRFAAAGEWPCSNDRTVLIRTTLM